MPSFDARLRFPGQTRVPINVVVDVSEERISFISGDKQPLGDWPVDGINVESRPDGFHITLDQEVVILSVTDADRFAGQLGVARSTSPSSPPPDAHVPKSLSSRLSGLDPEEQFADVRQRIDILANALINSAVSPEDVFGRWLRLLKEINRRHGQGAMPTPVFYRFNSELLDLIPAPSPTPPQQVIDSKQAAADDSVL